MVARSSLPPRAPLTDAGGSPFATAPQTTLPGVPATTQRPHSVLSSTSAEPYGNTPYLVVVAQDGTLGQRYALCQPQMDIGRSEGDILLPNDRFVCPRHGRLLVQNEGVFIVDLGSVNGVYRRLLKPTPIESGDFLLLGLEVLRFEALDPSEQRFSAAIERGTELFGTPAGPRYARLTERSGEGISRSIFVLGREETILGREVGDIVFSSDPFMSRRHAAITRNPSDGSFTLIDLGSSNGTFLRIRERTQLMPGDHVRVGQHLFRFDYDDGQGQAHSR